MCVRLLETIGIIDHHFTVLIYRLGGCGVYVIVKQLESISVVDHHFTVFIHSQGAFLSVSWGGVRKASDLKIISII